MSHQFLEDLARPQPDPGGGAAAAFGARVALALVEKVARLEYQRPRKEESGAFWGKIRQEIQEIAHNLADLQEQDVQAYFQLTRALAAGDAAALVMAVRRAVQCPGEIMVQARQGLNLITDVGQKCRSYLISDLQVACELLGGVLLGAYHIARANLPFFQDEGNRQIDHDRLNQWRDAALAARDRARMELGKRAEPV
ncbi:MAG: cyclodeaminase/cyclohydrolase family protein [Deltaproteobacteria bacterium]|nr:cyclodeaminase/cyclohydrolase family protein [Deltaproteobacteria bacterium]